MPKGRRAWALNPLQRIFNLLAAVFLGLSVIVFGWVVIITVGPYGRLNPFPPTQVDLAQPTPVAVVIPPTETSTPKPEPETATPTLEPETATPAWSVTPTDTDTPTPWPTVELSVSPTSSATASATLRPSPTRSVFTYTASITYQVHPVQVCDWMGIAGTVVDLKGKPVLDAFVHVWGLGNIDQAVAAGANPSYGPSGWEVRLARAQIVGKWNMQLVASPETKTPLSDIYVVSMPGDCKRNLALVSFQQNH